MTVDAWTNTKVTAAHQAKLAYVYIRQSSLGQVIHHGESTELQYQLTDRAVGLGWPRERVQVIDEDLGKSGATSTERQGFQTLIADIGLGRVGLVMSFDASRLARNNGDWYRLIELCSMFGTLIADGEQLYDPRLYHDRLLLGLSGMMSEAELHHLKRRLHAGARHKAERGELKHPLPVGLSRQRDGNVILNPDAEVQARLRLIFTKFDELGSARAVRDYLSRAQLRIPVRPPNGPSPHETVWNLPRASSILQILHNPAYAGAYVHGRRIFDPARQCLVELPVEQWAICLQDVYPAYITWDTYLTNRQRLQANRNAFNQNTPGVPGKGQALLQGIVVCGRCGRHMGVSYTGAQGLFPTYRCQADAHEYGGANCQEVRGLQLDRMIAQLVLEALQPERIALALAALEQVKLEIEALNQQWQLRLERARFEAQRAQRQYGAVEPEHRLVARHLEQEWEQKLRAVETVEHDYSAWQRAHHGELTAADRQAILAIGEDLSGVWHAPTTTMADRKHLLRLVIKEILVDGKRVRGKVWFQINWQTGAHSEHDLTRYDIGYKEYVDGDRVEARIRQLYAAQQTDQQIAAALNAEGYRTTRGGAFRSQTISYLRIRWGLASVKFGHITPDRLRWSDGAYTILGVMEALSVSKGTVHRWRKEGRLHGHQQGPHMPWRFPLTGEQIQTLRALVKRLRRPDSTSQL
jgi:DNA invertase Pin-like site-specific DNA recombinase